MAEVAVVAADAVKSVQVLTNASNGMESSLLMGTHNGSLCRSRDDESDATCAITPISKDAPRRRGEDELAALLIAH